MQGEMETPVYARIIVWISFLWLLENWYKMSAYFYFISEIEIQSPYLIISKWVF